MALALTYQISGNREDLSDIISLVFPQGTPIYNSIKKVKATGIYHEWQMDLLLPVNTAAQVEGDDVAVYNNMSQNRARTGVYIQTLRIPYMVSKQQEKVLTAGVSDEFARQKMLAVKNMLIGIEATIGSDNETAVDNGVTGYATRGLGKWIQSTAQAVKPVPTNYLTPSASIQSGSASLTETQFRAVLQNVYQEAGENNLNYRLVVGPTLKAQIALFSKTSGATQAAATNNNQFRYNVDGAAKKMYDGVDIYDSDWGMISVEPSMFLARVNGNSFTADDASQGTASLKAGRRGYLIRDDLLELAYLQDVQTFDNPDLGGGRRGYCDAMIGLCLLNPLGVGKFTG